jgi:hypothetical protein
MTLVLGTCVDGAVVLSADSKCIVATQQPDGSCKPSGSIVDRKLFKFGHVGVATHGFGPTNTHVPTIIEAERIPPLSDTKDVIQVIHWLQKRFSDATGMHALVGGFDRKGNPVLYDVDMKGGDPRPVALLSDKPRKIVLRGDLTDTEDQQPPGSGGILGTPGTAGSVMDQMLGLLVSNSSDSVGPPYEFLVIPCP